MTFSLLYALSAVVGYLLGSFPTGYLVGRARGIDIREHGSGNIGATNVVRVLGKKPGYFVFVCDTLKGLLAVYLSQFLASNLLHAAAEHALRHALELNPDQLRASLQMPAMLPTPATMQPQSVFQTQAATWQALSQTPSHGVMDFNTILIIAGIIAALACILGHNFPVWLKFRGGKGVATTVGVLLGLMPAAVGVAAAIWAASFYLFRYVSLASLLGAAALPVTVWLLSAPHGAAGLRNPLFWFSLAAAALIFLRHRANIRRLLDGTEPRFGRKPAPPAPPA